MSVIELKRLENDISNSVAQLVKDLKTNEEILKNALTAESLQERRLRQEMEKYKLGRSSSDIIIRCQDDRLSASRTALDAWGDYLQTALDLKLAENTLIDL